uniref:Uncharacterized protein n=1 Tax=viral metagenome TaxID=1070528 RepID=A0A6C0AX22_9ZZZZ|tara:strand:+ start:23290 stop:24153 length:864 start_codon:yes stop_codon:yes gene_type:complete
MNILSLEDSNTFIINLLQKNEPFLITRLGYANSIFSSNYHANIPIVNLQNIMQIMASHDGIYHDSNENAIIYAKKYNEAIKNSSALATFHSIYNKQQDYYISTFNLKSINSRVLEPFYYCLENIKPWSHYLIGKKVLIINPFVESFKKQIDANFQIFKDPEKKIFLHGQEFVFYKSYQCLAGNKPHNNWLETYEIMCNDIKDLDFDIALLACGGYGLPLCNYIYKDLNKSAIYIGGGLQLLFGVMGKRWENNEIWNKIIKENDTKFIKPSALEMLKNNEKIEGGCYW